MRVLVFVLIVIANFSDNGKASIDSIIPVNANLLEDTTRNSDMHCSRPCKFNVKPRKCTYKFKVEPSIDENGKATIRVNGMIPGPQINVCIKDVIVVEVENRIPDQNLAIHWHGIDQKGTPFMDGVPMITQCPIQYGSKYKYSFRASSAGTYFYHAYSVSQQSDGVFGSLIVNQPQPLEPHSVLYDYDRSEENTLIVSANFPQILTGNLEDLSQIQANKLNVNGSPDSFKMFVLEKYAYRLRLINAISIDCPVLFNIESHDVLVIATDGKPVRPVSTKNVLLYPGERMDVVVRATQAPSGYWIHVEGYGALCADLEAKAMLIYNGFNYTSMLGSDEILESQDKSKDRSSIVFGQTLETLTDYAPSVEVKQVYLGIDRNTTLKEEQNDFKYDSDSIHKQPYFPPPFSIQEDGVVQINRKSFLFPYTPLLLDPKELQPELICNVGEESLNKEPQCIQMLTMELNEVVELALVNEGFGSNDTYTFHLHGYNMEVVGTWQDPNHKPLTKSLFKEKDQEGEVKRNLVNPSVKDTVVVPNKGYAIVRIRAEHTGAWMLECRSCGLYSLPTAIVISVQQKLPNVVLNTLPKCGNYKPPDVLLN